ncbi:MAG: hypothetical protein WC458_01025 [Patescibacteria group bacterium]
MIKKHKLRFTLVAIFIAVFLAAAGYSFAQSADNIPADAADAIAVRVMPNPNHYSVSRWYESQGFKGSPQALIVDGYEAIRDGRTVYVNAANIDPTAKTIYTNIYLISYNQNPAPKTVDILGQIVSHWKFNDNLPESVSPTPTCSISSLSCATSANCAADQICVVSGSAAGSCALKTPKNCLVDTDCPADFFCDSVKSRITRDIKRAGKLEDLKEALANFKNINKHYPFLAAGTYLSGHSVSLWPSWSQSLLSELAAAQDSLDPINRLGYCQDYDAKTCWNENTKRFFNNQTAASSSLILPAGSYALVYSTDTAGSLYNLCAVMESRNPADANLGYHFLPEDLAGSACVSATGVLTGGLATNTAPRLVDKFLTGDINKEFNGFIKVSDAENNPLTWTLNTVGTDWTGWQGGPVLKDTSNPNQKKVYAQTAGNPGTYNMSLTVTDGQGGILATSTPIKIVSASSLIEAEDAEYAVDPVVPLSYNFSFSNPNPPVTYSVTRLSGPFDLLNLPAIAKTLTATGTNRSLVNFKGLIPLVYKFSNDADFKYRITVTDKFGAPSSQDFNFKVLVTRPQLNFNCPTEIRWNSYYSCPLGADKQGNHNITYTSSAAPLAGMEEISSSIFEGTPLATTTGWTTTISATNEYGTASSKSLTLKVNSYCGDGYKQAPNMEGRGGIYNDGYEDCDGLEGVVSSVSASSINSQYGCMTGVNASVPTPIITNSYCVFKSPTDGGGYCGDGYCQAKIGNNNMENCWNCQKDCGNCIATVESYATDEQIVYLNGKKRYKTQSPSTLGIATTTLATGNNIFAFWLHNIADFNDYGLAFRILVGPTSTPYYVMDSANSALSCAAPEAANPALSTPEYNPAGELKDNDSYNWTEINFNKGDGFASSSVINLGTANAFTQKNSPLKQITVLTGAVGSPLPYIWGEDRNDQALYCRLDYFYRTDTLGTCLPSCENKSCGSDGCGGTCPSKCAPQYYPDGTLQPMQCANDNSCCYLESCFGRCGNYDRGCSSTGRFKCGTADYTCPNTYGQGTECNSAYECLALKENCTGKCGSYLIPGEYRHYSGNAAGNIIVTGTKSSSLACGTAGTNNNCSAPTPFCNNNSTKVVNYQRCVAPNCTGKCGGALDDLYGIACSLTNGTDTCTYDSYNNCYANACCHVSAGYCDGKCGGVNGGCGRICGQAGTNNNCPADKPVCNQTTGLCYKPCTPDCTNKCGGASDGCTGSCNGTVNCSADKPDCNENPGTLGVGTCCKLDCVGKCGGVPDGCGGTCGSPSGIGSQDVCADGQRCVSGVTATCCTPKCSYMSSPLYTYKICPEAGEGLGKCRYIDTYGYVHYSGSYVTNYQCTGYSNCLPAAVTNNYSSGASMMECGPDGCGGTCGTCASGKVCGGHSGSDWEEYNCCTPSNSTCHPYKNSNGAYIWPGV